MKQVMQKDTHWWIFASVCLAVALALLGYTFWVSNTWRQRAKIYSEVRVLKEEVTVLGINAENLRKEIDGLRNDKGVQEAVVREELGYLKPEEISVSWPNSWPNKGH